ncbi:hypothetical protein [Microcystis phage Mae-JY09]
MGALPSDGLPPGPWTVEEHERHDAVILGGMTTGLVIEVGRVVKGAGPAFAALPERIAREDRVREVCAFYLSGPASGEAAVAERILRILDGEEAA